MSSQDIIKDAAARMKKTIEATRVELSKVRTGRASVDLLDHIRVDSYGSLVPLSQVGSISVSDARTLTIKLWDKAMIQPVEKAIMESDLGLNPATAGEIIRVPIPLLTEERRREMAKVVRHEGENGKVAVRNIRRDANQHMKELVKEKEISEDEEKRGEAEIQKLTDKHIGEIDALVEAKEKDIMTL